MLPINALPILYQLEGTEYLYRIISTILPTVCLDYKVCNSLKTTWIHVFDVLFNSYMGNVSTEEEIDTSIKQIGINYLLDYYSNSRLFNTSITPGNIKLINNTTSTDDNTNYILNTHSFNDLTEFTKNLVLTRLTQPEAKSRFIGGYVRSNGAPDIISNTYYPTLSFDNTYLLNLTYDNVVTTNLVTSFRARLVNGVLITRDLINLLGIRSLLQPYSMKQLDEEYKINEHASSHNIVINQDPQVDLDIITMKYKYLLMYYQHFSSYYEIKGLLYNKKTIISSKPNIVSIIASMHYQLQIKELLEFHSNLSTYNTAIIKSVDNTGAVTEDIINIAGLTFVDISNNHTYYLTLLSMLARASRVPKLESKCSLFWDGIPYEEYKEKKLADVLFIQSTCYVFGLFNKDGNTYCSLFSDLITAKETPFRICFLPRVITNKTVPFLIAEVLTSINNMAHKEFPQRSKQVIHIGLSENGFMRFFQILRIMTNKPPEIAIKEILFAYAGIKLNDCGEPHHIRKEYYKEFTELLLTAMGFKVTIKNNIIGSKHHTSLTISPRVSKQYIINALNKTSCSKQDTEKLISTAHDLLHFIISASDTKDSTSYYFRHIMYPNPILFMGGSATTNKYSEEDESIIQLSKSVNLIDRINVRGIFSAKTMDEQISVDVFSPENTAFKNNLTNLINRNQLTGEHIANILPNNIIDKLISTGGNPFLSVEDFINSINPQSDDNEETHEIITAINSALRHSYTRDAVNVASQAMNTIALRSEKQMMDIKNASCQMATFFKSLAKSIYTIEKIFKTKVSDEVKEDILEKYKSFVELSKSLYVELIALDTLKALFYIVKRSGRNIEDANIGAEDLRKAYDLIKPKIQKIIGYYVSISKSYYDFLKTNLNMKDSNSISFDTE
ncbi:virion major core protein P4a [Cetacean poxvirus 1]|nr:virion major core protein P4a [Cetacean poxvirus 1]